MLGVSMLVVAKTYTRESQEVGAAATARDEGYWEDMTAVQTDWQPCMTSQRLTVVRYAFKGGETASMRLKCHIQTQQAYQPYRTRPTLPVCGYLSIGKVVAGLTCCEDSGELFLEDSGVGVWVWKTM